MLPTIPPISPTPSMWLYTLVLIAMATFCADVRAARGGLGIVGKPTTTITIVLCPREKNKPQVTGSWPRLMRLRVALSIALRRGWFQVHVRGEEHRTVDRRRVS